MGAPFASASVLTRPRYCKGRASPDQLHGLLLLISPYAFYYSNVFSIIIYHHMPRERRCLRHSGAQQCASTCRVLPQSLTVRRRGLALRGASSPLHRDGSASRQPSSHSLHGITASNTALPSHKFEGLLGPLRPWSGRRSCTGSCGGPRRDLDPPPICARLARSAIQTKMGAHGRSLRVCPCHRILEATTMR
jgi:hypothetical protein